MDIRFSYRCDACGTGFQAILGDIATLPTKLESAPVPCPLCGGTTKEISLREFDEEFGDD